MPNHIKNKITLSGTNENVKQLVEKFSTFYPTTPSTAFDGRLTYRGPGDYNYGWLNEQTGIFSQRNKPDSVGVPEGFIQSFEYEWTRFPDFEKVFPVPESIKAVGDSVNSSIVHAVKAKYYANVSKNALLSMLELSNRARAEVKPEDQKQFELACSAYEETGYCYWYDWNCDKWGTRWNAYNCDKISEVEFTFETAWSGVVDIIKETSKNFTGTILYKFADEDTGYNTGEFNISGGIILSENRPEGGSVESYELAFELRPHIKENYKLVDGKYEYVDKDDDN